MRAHAVLVDSHHIGAGRPPVSLGCGDGGGIPKRAATHQSSVSRPPSQSASASCPYTRIAYATRTQYSESGGGNPGPYGFGRSFAAGADRNGRMGIGRPGTAVDPSIACGLVGARKHTDRGPMPRRRIRSIFPSEPYTGRACNMRWHVACAHID